MLDSRTGSCVGMCLTWVISDFFKQKVPKRLPPDTSGVNLQSYSSTEPSGQPAVPRGEESSGPSGPSDHRIVRFTAAP